MQLFKCLFPSGNYAFQDQSRIPWFFQTARKLSGTKLPFLPSVPSSRTVAPSSPAATSTCGGPVAKQPRGREGQRIGLVEVEPRSNSKRQLGGRWGNRSEIVQFAASPATDLAGGGVPSAGADGSVVPSDPSLIRPWYCSGSFACLALCFPNYCY